MESILNQVIEERKKQDSKWGEQNHPCLDQVLLNRKGGCTSYRMTKEYNVPSETMAKLVCDNKAKAGKCTWADIALEEFCEIVSEFNDEKRKEEVIQLAAVCIAWAEKIDRDIKRKADALTK